MKIKYFSTVKTIEELKIIFRDLAMVYHPDRPNGNLKVMQEINREYEIVFEELKKTSTKRITENSNEFIEVINKLQKIDIPYGVVFKVIGTWLWVFGDNAQKIKTQLLNIGFREKKSEKSFYWADKGFVPKIKHKTLSISEKIERYGSKDLDINKKDKNKKGFYLK